MEPILNLDNTSLEAFFQDRSNSGVKDDMFELFRASVVTHEFNPDPFRSYHERLLVSLCALGSVYQAIFEVNHETVFEFGIEMVRLKTLTEYFIEHKNLHKPKAKGGEVEVRRIRDIVVRENAFSIYSATFGNRENKALLFFIIPTAFKDPTDTIRNIVNFTRTYYFYLPRKNPHLTIKAFSEFKEHLQKSILEHPYQGGVRGVLAHFHIEDLYLYCRYMGEQFSHKIIKDVSDTIRKFLKKHDLLYTINRRSFVTYLPDCDVETVSKRFEDVFFKLDPMIIKFKLDFYEVHADNVKDEDFMDKILSSELRTLNLSK